MSSEQRPTGEPWAPLSRSPRREAGPCILLVSIVRVGARGFGGKAKTKNKVPQKQVHTRRNNSKLRQRLKSYSSTTTDERICRAEGETHRIPCQVCLLSRSSLLHACVGCLGTYYERLFLSARRKTESQGLDCFLTETPLVSLLRCASQVL